MEWTASEGVSLGEFLREERERRGFTLEQVASATRIAVKVLQFLEGDRFVELPAIPFVRGFVLSYCRFIGLDGALILERFGNYIELKSRERPNRESGHSGYVFEKRIGQHRSRTSLFIALVSFISLGGLVILIWKPKLKHHKSHLEQLKAAQRLPPHSHAPSGSLTPLVSEGMSAQQVEEPAHQLPLPLALPASPLKPIEGTPQAEGINKTSLAASTPVPNLDPLDSGRSLASSQVRYRLIFKVLADIWVRYQVDERPVRHFVIRQGKVLVLKAQDKIMIEFSRPDWVELLAYGVSGQPIRERVDQSRFWVSSDTASNRPFLLVQTSRPDQLTNPFTKKGPLELSALPPPVASQPSAEAPKIDVLSP